MEQQHYSQHLKTGQHEQSIDLILRSPLTVLNGVSEGAAEALKSLDVRTVFDLAHSRVFNNAYELAFPSGRGFYRESTLVPSDVVGNKILREGFDQIWSVQPISHLEGIGSKNQEAIRTHLSVETIRDLALWPPFLAASEIAGQSLRRAELYGDEGIPPELVPKFDEYASEKSFYSVYVIDEGDTKPPFELKIAVELHDPALTRIADVPRTGAILRYEQSWTPIALTLGNLLHSMALAPGESTRIAIIDWTRRQGVRTSEDISQLEALSNSLMQTRSISEVTRAVAREAQSGFSNMNSNSTVSNNAYSTYGLQNSEQALAAAAGGAATGGSAGVAAGGVAGGAIGIVAGGVTGGFGAGIGAVPGMMLGGILGMGIGAGAGGLIGATSGGVGAFLGTAEFGSGQGSGSTTTVDAVTTTSSTGERDVAAEMAQNIDDRTHQHASTSRNRHASIVQEVSQQENEQISTRVVTNYNHMYALTIQYFEVVQVYNVRTTLVQKQDCLFIPFRPIKWNSELIALCRPILLRHALTPEMVYTLLTSENTTILTSPTYPALPAKRRSAMTETAVQGLRHARTLLNSFVSGDPMDGWRVPDRYRIYFLFHAFDWGPFFQAGLGKITYTIIIHYRDGSTKTVSSWNELNTLPESSKRIAEISHINYRLSSSEFDFAEALKEPYGGSIGLWLTDAAEGQDQEDKYASFTFSAHYTIEEKQINGNTVEFTLVMFSKTLSMNALIEHLNENTEHYTHHVLRTKGSPLVRRVLTNYHWQGKPLINQVDQEPVAISGNSLVFLLHEAHKASSKASQRYKVGAVSKRSLVPVGTGGVFAEAVRGRANSAEKLDITRFWNWQESPIPIIAPEIAPIQSGSRAMHADVRPGSLDAPTVQMMSPQALPTPQGLPAVLQAVSTQMFRDMSGIQQTAMLAQKALEQAMEGATTTGEQSSENLKQGLGFTKELLGKIVDMNSQFANTLAESGFGIMGMAMGGEAPSGGGLVNKGPSQIGALMNSAARLDAGGGGSRRSGSGAADTPMAGGVSGVAGATGGGGISGGAGAGSTGGSVLPGGSGSSGSVSGGTNMVGGGSRPLPSLERQVIESAIGLPPSSGSSPAIVPWNVPANSGSGDALDAPGDTGNPVLEQLRPLLQQASASDEDYDQALHQLIKAVEQAQISNQEPWPIYEFGFKWLPEAWNKSVDRAVVAFNNGQTDALNRLDKLLYDAASLPPLRGTTTQDDILGQLQGSLWFADLQAPSFSPGGAPLAISGRLMQRLPGGQDMPVPDATVRVTAAGTIEDNLLVTSGSDGRFSFTITHGVPDPDYAGIHRFTGFHDLEVYMSAHSTISNLVMADAKIAIPGRLVVSLLEASYDDDGSDARSHPSNNIVLAANSRKIWIKFLVTKGGQALVRHPLDGAPSLNGDGHVESFIGSTSLDGVASILYNPMGVNTGVGYLSIQVSTSDGQVAAGRADLQFG